MNCCSHMHLNLMKMRQQIPGKLYNTEIRICAYRLLLLGWVSQDASIQNILLENFNRNYRLEAMHEYVHSGSKLSWIQTRRWPRCSWKENISMDISTLLYFKYWQSRIINIDVTEAGYEKVEKLEWFRIKSSEKILWTLWQSSMFY